MSEYISDLHRNGFGILPSILPMQDVEPLRDSIAATVCKHSTKAPPHGYLGGLLSRNQDIAPYLGHPLVADLCFGLFGPHFRVSSVTGVVNDPGVERGDLHADWPHKASDESCMRGRFGDTLVHLVTFWMLTDFTLENGGTIVRPGSHRRPRVGDRDPIDVDKEVQILGRAGDVALLDARTWHAVAPNFSRQARVAVIVRYAPWWLNLNPLRRGTRDREVMVDRLDGRDPHVPPLSATQFDTLPEAVQSLLYSMVE